MSNMVDTILAAAEELEARGDRLLNLCMVAGAGGKLPPGTPTPDVELCAEGAVKIYEHAHKLRLQAGRLIDRDRRAAAAAAGPSSAPDFASSPELAIAAATTAAQKGGNG